MSAIRPILAALLLLLPAVAQAQTLKIGIAEDPDVLDPVSDRTFVGGMVLNAMCDRLFAVTADNKIVPNLATDYGLSEDGRHLTIKLREGMKFSDGEPLDADAVKFTIDRNINFPGSFRKSEFPTLDGVVAVDAQTVRIDLPAPFPPLLEVLAGRSGIVLAPKATAAFGDKGVGNAPPCIGAFKVVERVAQDRIVLERTPDYWNAQHIKLDKIIYQPLPDNTVRIANLRSGDLDMIERIQPTDFTELEKDPKLATATAPAQGYQGITINVANQKSPLGQDVRVRKALELSIDRDAINQVIANGLYFPDDQFQPPQSPFHDNDLPVPKRDVDAAKKLLAEAGAPHPSITMMAVNSPLTVQLAQMIQAMAADAGFEIKIQQVDFTTMLDAAHRGDFEAFIVGWSGFIDPDGNSLTLLRTGGANNFAKYSNPEVDKLFDLGRSTEGVEARKPIYDKISASLERDLPIIYLYHSRLLWAFSKSVHGFQPASDGLIRIKDLTKAP